MPLCKIVPITSENVWSLISLDILQRYGYTYQESKYIARYPLSKSDQFRVSKKQDVHQPPTSPSVSPPIPCWLVIFLPHPPPKDCLQIQHQNIASSLQATLPQQSNHQSCLQIQLQDLPCFIQTIFPKPLNPEPDWIWRHCRADKNSGRVS